MPDSVEHSTTSHEANRNQSNHCSILVRRNIVTYMLLIAKKRLPPKIDDILPNK